MPKILLVDDSGLTRMQLKHVLQDEGFEVFEAAKGAQIVKNTFHKEYSLKDMDLVILDLYLGDMDGVEVLKRIIDEHPYIPVIIHSVEKSRAKIMECIDIGATDYLLKTSERKILIEKIKRILPETKEDKDDDIEKFKKVLLQETDRAIRAGLSFSVIAYDLTDYNKEEQGKIFELAVEKLREIDGAFLLNNTLLLLLPFTNSEGEKVVEQKLVTAWKEGKCIKEQPETKKFIFPDNIEDKELIKKYKKEEIKNLIMHQVEI